ncbi:MAG: hypothetical protein KDJ52_07145 [Anaerolineae bacterium]|nr:hypothetical protein [Anaerolineae bacterium]
MQQKLRNSNENENLLLAAISYLLTAIFRGGNDKKQLIFWNAFWNGSGNEVGTPMRYSGDKFTANQ